jgi:hypothetical protein
LTSSGGITSRSGSTAGYEHVVTSTQRAAVDWPPALIDPFASVDGEPSQTERPSNARSAHDTLQLSAGARSTPAIVTDSWTALLDTSASPHAHLQTHRLAKDTFLDLVDRQRRHELVVADYLARRSVDPFAVGWATPAAQDDTKTQCIRP